MMIKIIIWGHGMTTSFYQDLRVVIMAGGSGKRLWPLSNEQRPKQLLCTNSSGLSLLQETINRMRKISSEVLVQSSKETFPEINSHLLRAYSDKAPRIITEPAHIDSAYAFTYQAALSEDESPDKILAIVPADHLIEEEQDYIQAFERAVAFLEKHPDAICLIGSIPNEVSEHYGYIETEQELIEFPQVYSIARFIEKPSRFKASILIDEGALWNCGIILAYPKTLIATVSSAIEQSANAQVAQTLTSAINQEPPQEQYPPDSSKLSFDYLVLEYAKNLFVVKSEHKLVDVGNFETLASYKQSEFIAYDSKDNIVIQNDYRQKTIGLLGLKNTLLVSSPDAMLIANRSDLDAMKKLYDLVEKDSEQAQKLSYSIQERPWGTWRLLHSEVDSGFWLKIIKVDAQKRLSLQSHEHRQETWIVLSGRALVEIDDETIELEPLDKVTIEPHQKHRLMAYQDSLTVLEIARGSILDEQDIIRYEDDFGRI
ncbi:MAG: sugar phosphate nucleotidyltransferase [Coriobacteriia bacterium]|nr:sugar phosphate nucleotidyltransferase [Coriobacteriia bacterium]